MDHSPNGGAVVTSADSDSMLFDLHLDALLPLFDQELQKRIMNSVQIIETAFSRYGPTGLSISYNGGKDSCVLLHLISLVFRKHSSSLSGLQAIYFDLPNSFPEVTTFAMESAQRYNFHLVISSKDFKSGLQEMLLNHPSVKAIFMGTRGSDPRGNVAEFAPTDAGWPAVMRVHPVLHWTYAEVWRFIRALRIPYCSLYNQGYTSIGLKHDTIPNPKLLKNGSYCPAHLLEDAEDERKGRVSAKSLSSL